MSESPREFVQREAGSRPLRGPTGVLIIILCIGWSLFQLALPRWLLLSSEIVRCVHLAFAISLAYLCFPAVRRPRTRSILQRLGRGRLAWLMTDEHAGWLDLVLALTAAGAALYLAIDYEGIASRMGRPLPRDLLVGSVLVILLLEAARRALGLALPLIAGLFILYAFHSESMPAVLAFRNVELDKLLTKLTLTTEGIYGVPLDVSASVVFLFVLFGATLEQAGGGKYFINLAYSLLGRFRGGPAKAAVLASGLTGMVNGSSIANTVTTGTFTIPLMIRAGFPAVKAGAIEVAASTNGQLMPPIMGAAAFIIAEYCNISYLEVVRAAFVPAVISYLALIWIVHIEAGKLGLSPQPAADLPRFRDVFPTGLHFLLPLVFLITQLVVFRRSAQLAAFDAILVLYFLILLQRLRAAARGDLGWLQAVVQSGADIALSLIKGARNMIGIGVAVAAAGIIVGVVTLGLGNAITEIIDVLSGGNLLVMLVITAAASLLLGMGLPTTANYIVMASLTAPAIFHLANAGGYHIPLIAAHLFVFYFGILSDDTPPVGLSAYAAAAISRADPIRTGIQGFTYDMRTALLPFMFFFNNELLLIGVDDPWHAATVLGAGLIAMIAFASCTQRFFLRRNQWYESVLLAAISLMLLRPGLWEAWFALPRTSWYWVGGGLFTALLIRQRWQNLQSE